ncbi:hypothetical protein [Thiomonas sp.]
MARSLQAAEAKWTRKTANAGTKWQEGVSSGNTPCAGLRSEYGISNCNIDQSWRDGVSAVGASGFQASIQGKGGKWLQNFQRGLAQG